MAVVIIDFHTHIFPPRLIEERASYLRRDLCFAALYSDPKARMASAEELIASMNRSGVDISVVLNIGWASHELCVETNDYILEASSRYPDRLIGFCAVQPQAGDVAIAEMERCARAGARGLGELRPDAQGFDLTDEAALRPLAEAALQHHLICLFHSSEPVGHLYPGKGTVTPDLLYRFISSFPGLHIVCAHWGGGLPFYVLMPEVAQALSRVYFDCAATWLLYRPEVFWHVASLVGAEHILFGTDYPLQAQGRCLERVHQLGLLPEVEALILGGSAERLLVEARS